MKKITEEGLASHFDTAAFYRKTATLSASNVRESAGNEKIVTMVEGRIEREGVTKPGDKVVTGTKGEQYIITKEKFPTLYEVSPEEDAVYRSKNSGWVKTLEEDTTVVRSDGTEITGKAGDALLLSSTTSTLNVIDAGVFAKTYRLDLSPKPL